MANKNQNQQSSQQQGRSSREEDDRNGGMNRGMDDSRSDTDMHRTTNRDEDDQLMTNT